MIFFFLTLGAFKDFNKGHGSPEEKEVIFDQEAVFRKELGIIVD